MVTIMSSLTYSSNRTIIFITKNGYTVKTTVIRITYITMTILITILIIKILPRLFTMSFNWTGAFSFVGWPVSLLLFLQIKST